MVLLLLLAGHWLAAKSRPAARLQLGLAIVLIWTPAVKEHLLTLNADESQFTGSPVAWIALGAEHAVALGLTALLIVALTGWGWRRLVGAEGDQRTG